ncbi:MAG TPA: hypothetical protein VK307_07125 [Thermoleophilaceae bacterium]|nr:hypothetical protein [Thermoleophilaceae bacterium]
MKRHRASLLIAGLVALSGCGGGERQDENEPEGDFPVEVVRASFPDDQKLAKSSKLRITVRNAGKRTIPNVALTIDGFDYSKKADGELADTSRPVFAVDGVPVQIGGLPEAKEATPLGCDTAYVSTWGCGPLRPGRERTFEWSVTAVRAGPYRITWSVAAGLDGNARAVTPGDRAPRGSFTGTISDEAPEVRVADDGKTVVTGTR